MLIRIMRTREVMAEVRMNDDDDADGNNNDVGRSALVDPVLQYLV